MQVVLCMCVASLYLYDDELVIGFGVAFLTINWCFMCYRGDEYAECTGEEIVFGFCM